MIALAICKGSILLADLIIYITTEILSIMVFTRRRKLNNTKVLKMYPRRNCICEYVNRRNKHSLWLQWSLHSRYTWRWRRRETREILKRNNYIWYTDLYKKDTGTEVKLFLVTTGESNCIMIHGLRDYQSMHRCLYQVITKSFCKGCRRMMISRETKQRKNDELVGLEPICDSAKYQEYDEGLVRKAVL